MILVPDVMGLVFAFWLGCLVKGRQVRRTLPAPRTDLSNELHADCGVWTKWGELVTISIDGTSQRGQRRSCSVCGLTQSRVIKVTNG